MGCCLVVNRTPKLLNIQSAHSQRQPVSGRLRVPVFNLSDPETGSPQTLWIVLVGREPKLIHCKFMVGNPVDG